MWNDFRTHFQDNQIPSFVLFGEFVKIYRYIYSGFPEGNTIVSKRSKFFRAQLPFVIERGFKQHKGFSLIHFLNHV